MKYRIASVFGTRPEAIKMAPLVRSLEKSNNFSSVVIVSAQHREMLDQVLKLFAITPDYDLNVMKKQQSLSQVTTDVIVKLEQVIHEVKPDLLLVHGDTTTTFAAALSTFYQQVPVAHVEAGLRTGDKYAPFPEEMNRKLVGSLADLHFAPTIDARDNLLAEGLNKERIFVTGNTVIDALKASVREDYHFIDPNLTDFSGFPLDSSPQDTQKLITLEVHRRENWGQPLKEIFYAVRQLVEKSPEIQVIFPVHRNPAVREPAQKILGGCERVFLTDPLTTRDFHNLMARSYLILTDSGGIQEEAPSFGVPVLVLREKTERDEGLRQGTVLLTGNKGEKVYQDTMRLLSDESLYQEMKYKPNPYGDGFASARILQIIEYFFGLRKERPLEFMAESQT